MAQMNVERIAIADLSQDPANARVHPERNLAAITASLRRFGQQTPIVIDKSNVVRKGNGTLQAAIAMGWDSIDCIRTELTSSDAIAYAIADNRTSELAEWDDDILAAQLNGLLADDPDLLDAAGFDEDELAAMLDEIDGDGTTGGIDDTYTAKIVAPIYEPKGDRPAVSELFDNTKTLQLVADIKAADLPKEVAEFLMLAAERHTSFHFRNIAEFYCHADATTQDLMERSGLVIIDFDKAIECGFVHMTDRLGQLADAAEMKDEEAEDA
jgi:hypothetical protein